jgi:hypothetical protein
MWLWRKNVYCVHRRVQVPPLLYPLDICFFRSVSLVLLRTCVYSLIREAGWAGGGRTRDILIENVIFLDDIVDDLLSRLIQNEDFPLGDRTRPYRQLGCIWSGKVVPVRASDGIHRLV